MNVQKQGHRMAVSLEMLATCNPGAPQRKGRIETIPLTDADRKAWRGAEAAMELLANSKWVDWDYDGPILKELKPRTKFVPEESQEEYDVRLRDWAGYW